MNTEEYIKQLNDIFSNTLFREVELQTTTTAKDVEGWDSLTNIALMVSVEEQFNISFPMGSVENAQNIGELIEIIKKLENGEF